ncbi:hypothetical protein Tco_0050836 [Tanacetum coccineum]
MSNTNNMQTQTSSALHNAIMEAGGKDRPPMQAPGNYLQWESRIKRYIDTKPNHELIHYCLENPPYEKSGKRWMLKLKLFRSFLRGFVVPFTEWIFAAYKG